MLGGRVRHHVPSGAVLFLQLRYPPNKATMSASDIRSNPSGVPIMTTRCSLSFRPAACSRRPCGGILPNSRTVAIVFAGARSKAPRRGCGGRQGLVAAAARVALGRACGKFSRTRPAVFRPGGLNRRGRRPCGLSQIFTSFSSAVHFRASSLPASWFAVRRRDVRAAAAEVLVQARVCLRAAMSGGRHERAVHR